MSSPVIIPVGETITMKDGVLFVPDHPIIPFVEGDGTGPDIWAATKRVIDTAVDVASNGTQSIAWVEVYAGEKSNVVYGPDTWLPEETIELFSKYFVGIKGPLTTPVGKGARSINVALRQKMDLYVCERPVRWYEGVPSPVKHPERVDMVIFRENTEDVYAGIEWSAKSPEAQKVISFLLNEMGVKKIRFPESSAIGIKPVSEEGSKRLIRSAIQYAIKHQRKSVTIVHKGNIMKFTEGGFLAWGYELATTEFRDQCVTWEECKGVVPEGKILVKDCIADSFLQQILLRPTEYDVIATTNLNGDYVSDALAAEVGGLGIAPGANINYVTGHAVFEATHGTAPKYAGMDKVNPGSLILSAVMMLRYMGWAKAADLIETSLAKTIQAGTVTYDLARQMKEEGRTDVTELKCSEFADQVIAKMR